MLRNLRGSKNPELLSTGIVGAGVNGHAALVSPYYNASRAKHVAFVCAGTNDIASGASGLSTLAAYYVTCDAMRAQGWSVIGATVCARSGGLGVSQAAYNAEQAAFNANLLSSFSGHCDNVADIAGNPLLGAPAASDNLTNFQPDKIHPNTAGHALMEPIYRAAAASLL